MAFVRTIRDADAGTDHNLVIGKLKLRLSRLRTTAREQHKTTYCLKNKEKLIEFCFELKKRLKTWRRQNKRQGQTQGLDRQ